VPVRRTGAYRRKKALVKNQDQMACSFFIATVDLTKLN